MTGTSWHVTAKSSRPHLAMLSGIALAFVVWGGGSKMTNKIVNTWKIFLILALKHGIFSIYGDTYVHRHGKMAAELPCFEYILLFDVKYLSHRKIKPKLGLI